MIWRGASRDDPEASDAPRRRLEDGAVTLLLTDPRPATSLSAGPESVAVVDLEAWARGRPTPERLAHSAFLLDFGGEEAVLLPAADAYLLPRGSGGEELQRHAAAAALAWRHARHRLERRLLLPDWLLAYADELNSAERTRQVHAAVTVHLPLIVGAAHAVVYDHQDGDDEWFRARGGARRLPPLRADVVMRLTEPTVLTSLELGAGNGVYQPLAVLSARFGDAHLVCAPLGADALLVLVERRRDRAFTGEDWDLLRGTLRQAEAALRRLSPAP